MRMKLSEIPWTMEEDRVLLQIHEFYFFIITFNTFSREFEKIGLAQKWNLVSKEL